MMMLPPKHLSDWNQIDYLRQVSLSQVHLFLVALFVLSDRLHGEHGINDYQAPFSLAVREKVDYDDVAQTPDLRAWVVTLMRKRKPLQPYGLTFQLMIKLIC